LDFVKVTFFDLGLEFLVGKWRRKKLCGGSNIIEKGLVIRSDLDDALCQTVLDFLESGLCVFADNATSLFDALCRSLEAYSEHIDGYAYLQS